MKITISFENGKIGIEGPLQDKLFMYGILELAKDVVKAYEPKLVQPAILSS